MVSAGTSAPDDGKPQAGRSGGVTRQIAMATELPVVLVACVIVGAAAGIGLDRLLHSGPIGMLVFGVLGFIAGVREILRRLGKSGDGGGGSTSK